MRNLIVLVSIAAVGCVSANDVRERPEIGRYSTLKSVAEVGNCLNMALSRTPGAITKTVEIEGGISLLEMVQVAGSRSVLSTIDIVDAGQNRTVSVHSMAKVKAENRNKMDAFYAPCL